MKSRKFKPVTMSFVLFASALLSGVAWSRAHPKINGCLAENPSCVACNPQNGSADPGETAYVDGDIYLTRRCVGGVPWAPGIGHCFAVWAQDWKILDNTTNALCGNYTTIGCAGTYTGAEVMCTLATSELDSKPEKR